MKTEKELKAILRSLEVCVVNYNTETKEIRGIHIEIEDTITLVATNLYLLMKFELSLDCLDNLKNVVADKYGFELEKTCVIHFQKKDELFGIQEKYIHYKHFIETVSDEAKTDEFYVELFNLEILSKINKVYNILKIQQQNIKPSFQNGKNKPIYIIHDDFVIVVMPLRIAK